MWTRLFQAVGVAGLIGLGAWAADQQQHKRSAEEIHEALTQAVTELQKDSRARQIERCAAIEAKAERERCLCAIDALPKERCP